MAALLRNVNILLLVAIGLTAWLFSMISLGSRLVGFLSSPGHASNWVGSLVTILTSTEGPGLIKRLGSIVFGGGAVILAAVAIFGTAMAALAAASLWPFGGQILIIALVRDITIEATPLGEWTVGQFLNPGNRLSHSTYDDPIVVQSVCQWLTNKLGK
jgi:hypothetical protein